MKNNSTARDIALIAAILAAALIIFAVGRLPRSGGSAVEIRLNGEIYATMPLSDDAELDIAGLCLLRIENGEAKVVSANCKNQICVRHRAIKSAGEVIVCLPNGVTVKVVGDGGTDFVI